MEFSLTENEKQILLSTARESISSKLENRNPDYQKVEKSLLEPLGSFVTLHIEGGVIAENSDEKGLLSSMINGKD